MGFCCLMPCLFLVFLLVLVPVIADLSDEEKVVCRDLGFIANSGVTTIEFEGITQDQVKLIVNCSITPTTWCRAQFDGQCYCMSHNDTSGVSIFPENTTFLTSSIFLLLNVSEFRKTFAGSFIVCASSRSIHKAYHIAASYTKVNTDDSDQSEARQAAINTIIVCLTSILVCVGPCFVLTFISKWRQDQLRQKIIEGERENDNGPPPKKLYSDYSKINFSQRPSVDSQKALLSLKNFKRSTSSSTGSIYSISGEFCFKQEKIACGTYAEYWKGVYTGSLPNGSEKNCVCLKVSKSGGGVSEKMLLAEADFFEQVPPNDHIINYFLTFISKVGEGAITILELAKYGDLYSFLYAKKKAMVTQADKIWPKIDKGYMQMCAYATPTPPKLSVNISKLLDCYETSRPFNDLLSQPLSELDFLVFAHQIAAGLQHLSLHNVVHKRLTSESVLIFENFVLKVADFSTNEASEQTDIISRAPVIERNKSIARTPSGRPAIKWQAPEVMKNETYSSESDVWSYGMTLWEIMSYGETPFDDVVVRLLLKAIEEDHYPLRPENCSTEIYSLMKSCWRSKGHRPSFDTILHTIHDHLVVQPKKQSVQHKESATVIVEVINETAV